MLIDLTNAIKLMNPVYYLAFRFHGRFLVLYGGAASGKSYFASDKIICRLLMEDKHNILCARATGKSVTKSQFPLLCGEIDRWGFTQYFDINKSMGNEKITCKLNNNQVIFSGLDDVEKLKSIYDITSIWIEEANEILPEDFRELNRRLRGYHGCNSNGTEKYMQIIFTFNPVSELSWLKSRFFDENDGRTIKVFGEKQSLEMKKDINKKQLIYNGKLKKNVLSYIYNTLIVQSTYLDNHFIDDVTAEQMEELKKYDVDEYNIYALGMWGVPGGTYFSKTSVNERIKACRDKKPLLQGYFEFDYINERIVDDSIKWVNDDENGCIKIYEKPIKGYPYVGGGDTAGEGSDWNTGYFTNNVTEADVAALRLNMDEDLYARQMYCLGKCYNNALLGIETNFSTHPQKELERLGYRNFYVREETPDSFTHKLTKRYGFLTTKLTRPLALSILRTVVREHPERIKDMDLLEEMTVFVKNEKGRPEAAQGQHDDCIMARAINCYIASQQTKNIIREKKGLTLVQKDKAMLEKQLKRSNNQYYRALTGEGGLIKHEHFL